MDAFDNRHEDTEKLGSRRPTVIYAPTVPPGSANTTTTAAASSTVQAAPAALPAADEKIRQIKGVSGSMLRVTAAPIGGSRLRERNDRNCCGKDGANCADPISYAALHGQPHPSHSALKMRDALGVRNGWKADIAWSAKRNPYE